MKKYIKGILTLFSITLCLYTMYVQNSKITELKKQIIELKSKIVSK